MPRKKYSQQEWYTPKAWPRNPMKTLYSDYFYFHFTNQPTPRGRNGCYICFKVERASSPTTLNKGVFENQFYPKKKVHTELCFLNWFKNQKAFSRTNLGPGEEYHVTWYMSWSPCVECVQKVVEFLNEHPYVRLHLFAPRLYYSKEPGHQQGLRRLADAGAELAVMSLNDFLYCWETFVPSRGECFQPWKNLEKNSQNLSKTLEAILRGN